MSILYRDQPVPIFGIAPNWGKSVKMVEDFGGVVQEALSTKEERLGTRPRPLYRISFDTLALTPRESGYARKILESVEELPVGVPLWPFAVRTTVSTVIGNTHVVTESTAANAFDLVPYSILISDFATWEAHTTFDYEALAVQFAEAIAAVFPAASLVVPMALGWLKRPNSPALTDELSEFPVRFEERFLQESTYTPLPLTGGVPEEGLREFVAIGEGGPVL